MKKNKLMIAISAAVLIGIVFLLAYKAHKKDTSDNVIRVGAILPLTGAQSQDGVEIKNAFMLAAQEINKNKTLGYTVHLDISDSKYSSKEAIMRLNSIMGEKPDFIVVGGSVISLSLAPFALQYKIPMLALLASDDGLSDENCWMFRAFPSDKEEIELMIKYAADTLKVQKFAILTVDNIQGANASKFLKSVAKETRSEVCSQDTYAIDGTDMRSQISKIIKDNPDAIYVFGYGPGYCACINQIRELGFDKMILTWQAMSLVSYQNAIKGSRDNIYYSAPQFCRDLNGVSREFYDKYSEVYKKQPSFIAAFAYETMNMMANTFAQNAHDSESLCSGLMDIGNYESVTGRIGFNGHRGLETVPGIFVLKGSQSLRVK